MAHQERSGHPLGLHRVCDPEPQPLPQAAHRLDSQFSPLADSEILVSVERLNLDSASFRHLSETGDVAEQVQSIVRARGKMHNPVTGSGGMLLGSIEKIGSCVKTALKPGDRVASLVSLTLTPLRIDRIIGVNARRHQIDITGQAVLFSETACVQLPADLSETVALAVLDVAGAAPQVARRCTPGTRVLILGCAGKSGLLAAAAAHERGAVVIGIDAPEADNARAEALATGYFVKVLPANVQNPAEIVALMAGDLGQDFDLVVSSVNVSGAEMAAILPVRRGGTVYFFNMATSFAAAALGAEGILRDADLIIGNGYTSGHAAFTLGLLQRQPALQKLLFNRYG